MKIQAVVRGFLNRRKGAARLFQVTRSDIREFVSSHGQGLEWGDTMGLNDGNVVRFDGACTGCGIRGPAGRECTCGAQYHPDDDRFHYQGGEWRNGPNPGERDRGAQIRIELLRAGDVHPHPGPVQVFETLDGAGQKCGHRNCEHDADGGGYLFDGAGSGVDAVL